jgi:4-hydroxy-tetrahydrodipicolinate synthase
MGLSEVKAALRTVISIPVTPFRTDGSADFDLYAQVVARMVEGGIRVVTPNGNTGEFYSLTAEEHKHAVEATVAGAGQETLILAGVGFDAQTAAEMARFAVQRGAEAVMVHQPVHPYGSDDGWIAYHATIADAVPEAGIVPYVRDATIRAETLSRLADRCPNFVGIKYAVTNPLQFAGIVQSVGVDRITWVCGVAESWAPFFWPGGASGFTSGLVNVTTALSLEMQACLEQGDNGSVMEIWGLVRPFEELRARRNNSNNVSAVKEAMAQLGFCGATVRPPISMLSDGEKAEVRQILLQLGVAVAA